MKIGVVGLGLIGGSIFKALSPKYDVVAVSSSVTMNNVSHEYSILKDTDLVFVCTPMNVTLEILKKLNKILSPNTIVTDVCSLKSFLVQEKYNYKFIPSHPMAGTENSGWDSSFAELFKDAKWVITPIDGIVLDEQEVLEKVIEDMGANVVITSPDEHDKAVALISNLPLIVSQGLCKNIMGNTLAQTLAASGFRDTTRLALSNTQMAVDMWNFNSINIKESLKLFYQSIEEILEDDYKAKSKAIKDFRSMLY